MGRRRELQEAASDPTAKQQRVVEPNPEYCGLGHVVLAVAVGFALGVVGGFLSTRLFRLL